MRVSVCYNESHVMYIEVSTVIGTGVTSGQYDRGTILSTLWVAVDAGRPLFQLN